MPIPALILILLLPAAQEETVDKTFRFDCSSGERKANLEVETVETPFNPQDGKSIVFVSPGTSQLTARFNAPVPPTGAVLEIEHLSSGADVKFGGNSRITILLNAEPLVKEWEVGSHGYGTDRLTVTKMIREGENSLQIQFVGGETAYWLQRFEIHCTFPAGTDIEGKVDRIDGERAYAVVVSKRTYEAEEWRGAVETLRKRYDATIIVYPHSVRQARKDLAEVFPRYACFVARPAEAGRAYVIAVHRMTRALDGDPYTDVQWGILTGYEAADAMRIAAHAEPLIVRRAAAGCGLDLDAFEEGVWYSESEKNVKHVKEKGGKPEKRECPDDTTKDLVDLLNDFAPDLFVTSGHATTRDWQIGYSYENGQFRCKNGQLFGLDMEQKRYDIRSPNPKVYSTAGNCLIGLIEDRQTMALAWIHTGGAHQMLGYVVSTWYGYGGHGVNHIFIGQQGRFTFAESFYLNNQALVHRLESHYPKTAGTNFEEWNIETDKDLPAKLAERHGIGDREELGLLWDRDTVAFYGDPAWEARLERVRDPAWDQTLTEEDGTFTFEIETLSDGPWGRPPMALLPYRVKDVEVTEGADLEPLITDNFILVPLDGQFGSGDTFKVVFKGRRI